MHSRLWHYLFPNKNAETATTIDFKKNYFEPTNKLHRECIDSKINNLNHLYNTLIKTDLIIAAPFTLEILLLTGRVLGPGYGILACAAISSVLYASDKFQQHTKYKKEFHEQLNELLEIWLNNVKHYGTQISGDHTMLKIVNAIAPYLESQALINWKPNQTYPDFDFSEEFAKVLSTPPHAIPRLMLKGTGEINREEQQISQAALLPRLNEVASNNKWFALCKNTLAQLNFTLYGYKNNKAQDTLPQKSIWHLLK